VGPSKLTQDVERFLDRLWDEAKKKAFDNPGTYGKFGVIVEVDNSNLVQALLRCHQSVKMPRVNQHV